MNTIKLFNPVLLLIIICTLTSSCLEDPLVEEEDIELSMAGIRLPDNQLSTHPVKHTRLDCMYIEWKPWIFTAHRDQIRASFSDPNGIIYLVDYEVCPSNQNLEKWNVVYNMINPEDQTPPPLVILMDTEDEMNKAEHFNFSAACSF